MARDLPKYDAPPVVETVLGVQFKPLPAFTLAHAGWFWKSRLENDYTAVSEVARLQDVFERFGPGRAPVKQSIELIPVGKEAQRLHIVRADEERMVQLQNSRFIQNWRKKNGAYPSYGKLLPEFKELFTRFKAFASEAQLGEIEPNQWEIVYVNIIPQGVLWSSPSDWVKILPWLGTPQVGDPHTFDMFSQNEWRFIIGDSVGRLFITLNHVISKDGVEAMKLQMLARGPVNNEKGIDLWRGLDIAHETIVCSFTEMTSAAAHKEWKRTA